MTVNPAREFFTSKVEFSLKRQTSDSAYFTKAKILTLRQGTGISSSVLIIGAVYTLRLYKRIFFGNTKSSVTENVSDITYLERLIFFLMSVPILYFGSSPKFLMDTMHSSIVLHSRL